MRIAALDTPVPFSPPQEEHFLPQVKDIVEKVERGFPTKTVKTILRRIDADGRHFKVTDIIPKATYHRIKGGTLTRDQSSRVLGLARVLTETMRQYHDDAELARMFLSARHPLLGGRSPFDLAKESPAGAQLVLDLLARAEAGIPV